MKTETTTTTAPALPPEGQKSAAAAQKEIARLSRKQVKQRLSTEEMNSLADAKRAAAGPAKAAKKAPRRIAKASNKAPAKKAAPAKASAPADGRIPLKAICQKLDIDPKRARVVLRRRLRAGELAGGTHDIGGGRWNLTPTQAERVRETLKTFLREVQ